MSSMQGTGERNASVVEMHKNTKVERGAPEKQVAKCE
jgi:hypothetical protein